MRIELTTRFNRELDRLLTKQPMIIFQVEKVLQLLSSNPRHPSLRFHKLAGKDTYSVSVNMSIRIILLRRGDIAYLVRIGTHEEVY